MAPAYGSRHGCPRLRRTGLRVGPSDNKLDGKPGYKLVGSEPTRLTIELFERRNRRQHSGILQRTRSAVFAAREER